MTAPRHPAGTGSVAANGGYPLHLILASIPIAALVMAFGADIALMVTAAPFWGEAAKWLLLGALVFNVLAAVIDFVNLIGLKRARAMGVGLGYGIGNVLVLLVTGANCLLRAGEDAAAASGYGIILSATSVLLLMLTGWLGDALVFRRGVTRDLGDGDSNDPEFLSGGHPDLDGVESLRPLGPSLSAISTAPPPRPSDRVC